MFKRNEVTPPNEEKNSAETNRDKAEIMAADIIESLEKEYGQLIEEKMKVPEGFKGVSSHKTMLINLLTTEQENILSGRKTADQVFQEKRDWFLKKLGIDKIAEDDLGEIVLTGNAELDLGAMARLELGSDNLEIDNVPTPLGEKVYTKLEELYPYYDNIKNQENASVKLNRRVIEYVAPYKKQIK
jgi:hypothetical protein